MPAKDQADLQDLATSLTQSLPINEICCGLQPFTNSGFWDITYVDDDFRILYTNKSNVFVMEKIEKSRIKA